MSKFESLVYWLMTIPTLPVFIMFSFSGIAIGSLMIIKPSLAIEIQKRFYAGINWRIEPISMAKELRNTKLMGLLLLTFAIVVLILALTNKSLLIYPHSTVR